MGAASSVIPLLEDQLEMLGELAGKSKPKETYVIQFVAEPGKRPKMSKKQSLLKENTASPVRRASSSLISSTIEVGIQKPGASVKQPSMKQLTRGQSELCTG